MTFTYSFEAIGSQLFSFRVRQHIHILGRQLKASQSLSVQKQLKKMTHPQNAKENCHCFPRPVCACIIPASRAGWSQWLQGSKAGKTPTWGNSRQGPACLSCACSCFPLLRLPASHLLSLPRNYLLLGKLDQFYLSPGAISSDLYRFSWPDI